MDKVRNQPEEWLFCRKFPAHPRNLLEEWLFRLESPANRQEIHGRNGILAGLTSSLTRNPPKEGDSAGNYKLIDRISDGMIKMHIKSLERK
jgi:hypothetical protein